MKRKPVDLSSVFCTEPEVGQRHYDKMPREIWMHLAAAFAHRAGIAPDPGFYAGPVPKKETKK